MVIFYRSLSIYLPSGPGAKARAEVGMGMRAEVEALKAAWVDIEVLLFLIGVSPANSFLPTRKEGLRQAHKPVIWLTGLINSKND